jgi:hypothetical protein
MRNLQINLVGNLRRIKLWAGVKWRRVGYVGGAGFYNNKTCVSIAGVVNLDKVTSCQVVNEDGAPWS